MTSENEITSFLKDKLSSFGEILKSDGVFDFFGFDKAVRPDIVFRMKQTDQIIIVECKDDKAKNFNMNQLLHQCMVYRLSRYPDKLVHPLCVVYATKTSVFEGNRNFGNALGDNTGSGLANRWNIGLLSKKVRNNETDGVIEELYFKVGSQNFCVLDLLTNEARFDFKSISRMNIGSKSKSNNIDLLG